MSISRCLLPSRCTATEQILLNQQNATSYKMKTAMLRKTKINLTLTKHEYIFNDLMMANFMECNQKRLSSRIAIKLKNDK